MKTTHQGIRALALTVAASTALALSACQSETAGSGTSASPSATATSAESSATGSQSSPRPSESTPAGNSDVSSPSGSATDVPDSQREDSGDENAYKASVSAIPRGPMTAVHVERLGGYRAYSSSRMGTFYAVLKVDGTEGGIVELEYVLLDGSGKELGRVNDSINVGDGNGMIKVTQASGKAPEGTKWVKLLVKSNKKNMYAQDLGMDSVAWHKDSTGKTVVTGRYKTGPNHSLSSINAVCFDASGRPVADSGAVPEIKAPDWKTFDVELFDSTPSYQPTQCYAGQ